jgi:putative transposase
MRTRTKNPDGFMDGARRDRCAIVAEAVREWRAVDTNTAYIERGSPWENGYIESFNARHRDELLDGEIFYSLRKAKPSSRVGGVNYNRNRLHAPEEFVPALAAWPAAVRRMAPPATLAPKPALNLHSS